jgi:hypothetical protein
MLGPRAERRLLLQIEPNYFCIQVVMQEGILQFTSAIRYEARRFVGCALAFSVCVH